MRDIFSFAFKPFLSRVSNIFDCFEVAESTPDNIRLYQYYHVLATKTLEIYFWELLSHTLLNVVLMELMIAETLEIDR